MESETPSSITTDVNYAPARPANRKAGYLHPPAGATYEGHREGVQMKSIIFPAGTPRYVLYADIAHLIADALWPETGPDDERLDYAFSRVNLDDELKNAVTSGKLPVRNPLTLGPHTYPVGNALETAVVDIDDLREFVAERGLAVEFDAKAGREAPAGVGRRNQSETETVNDEAPPMKRSALIAELEHEWPSIEADLSDARRNGLYEAHAPRHGEWYPDKARAWAKSKGKLKAQAIKLSSGIFGGSRTINRIF